MIFSSLILAIVITVFGPCVGLVSTSFISCEVKNIEIEGYSLRGVVFPGDVLPMHPKSCVQIERQDLLIFTLGISKTRIIKKIWGVPGDLLQLRPDGLIYVNDQPVKRHNGRFYRVTRQNRAVLEAIESPLGGYLVFGVPGSIDSGVEGIIDYKDIYGVVKHKDIPSSQNEAPS